MHDALQHVGARAAKGERAYEQSEDQEHGLHLVEPKMYLAPGDQPDGQHRRNG